MVVVWLAMDSSANLLVLVLVFLFVWDKYNKGSEKAILENKDIKDLADTGNSGT